MPLVRLDKFEAQPDALSSVLNSKDESRRLGITVIHYTAIRESAMSRREPVNQIRWEDLKEPDNSYMAERSVVIAGPTVVPEEPEKTMHEIVAEWIVGQTAADLFALWIAEGQFDGNLKDAAKQLRKLADKIDPPTKFVKRS